MRKVEHYICEICGTEYRDKAEHCPKCGEVLHYSQGVVECRCGYWRFDKDDR